MIVKYFIKFERKKNLLKLIQTEWQVNPNLWDLPASESKLTDKKSN